MSLEKAIKYGKEKRKPYRKSKRFDRTCRNNGSCPYCRNNRTFKNKRQAANKKEGIDEYHYSRRQENTVL